MEPSELTEVSEKAHGRGERTIGLTMAIIAAILATVTLMGHRLHTEETVQQTKAADGWAFYQAKNGRYHMYAADAKLAELVGPQGASIAKEWRRKAEEEKADAEMIRHDNETLDEETHAIARRATYFDASEICLEVAIVLCSVALLTGTALFWRISFVGTGIGLIVAAMGFLKG
jgi:hypothetical protein